MAITEPYNLTDHRRVMKNLKRRLLTADQHTASLERKGRPADPPFPLDEKLFTTDTGYGWSATTKDYDGAPDAVGIDTLVGSGSTKQEAIADLQLQREEYGGPCRCGYEEGRSEADKRYHEENCL